MKNQSFVSTINVIKIMKKIQRIIIKETLELEFQKFSKRFIINLMPILDFK